MRRDEKYRKLAAAYGVVREQTFPEIQFEADDDPEIAMNLTLLEADLAGIADGILTNRNLPEMHKEILKHDVLRGSRLQLCLLDSDGVRPTEIDLSPLPDVLEYARAVENLRRACFEIVFGTRH